jgi:hypothetical protein
LGERGVTERLVALREREGGRGKQGRSEREGSV